MPSQSVFYDTRDLPTNVLTLVDDNFYDFVEQRLGVFQSMLLKIQHINSVPCFLLTDDPCDILNLNADDNDLNVLRQQICFPLLDGSFVIKPGVRNGFKCLRDLLTKTTDEKLKQSKYRKAQSVTAVSINTSISTAPLIITTSAPQTIIAPVSQTSVTPAPQTNITPVQQTTSSLSIDTSLTSIIEHRKYFLNLLKNWCFNHKDDFNLDTFELKEGKDFILNVLYNENNELEANIKCNCSRRISLSIKDGKIQLSNFQKHLLKTNCSHIQSIKKTYEAQKKLHLQQSTGALSSSSAVTVTSTVPIQQQSILQTSDSVSTGASSITTAPSSSTQTNSRKRSQPSSQISSSQKTKRSRI